MISLFMDVSLVCVLRNDEAPQGHDDRGGLLVSSCCYFNGGNRRTMVRAMTWATTISAWPVPTKTLISFFLFTCFSVLDFRSRGPAEQGIRCLVTDTVEASHDLDGVHPRCKQLLPHPDTHTQHAHTDCLCSLLQFGRLYRR